MTIIWLTSISCNGNAHSFLNYPQLEQFLRDFEFLYHPIIHSTYTLPDILDMNLECDILIIEGAISPSFNKINIPIFELIKKYSTNAKKVVTVGTCSSFGGIFREGDYPNTTGLHFDTDKSIDIFKDIKDKSISISGCPVHPNILVETLYTIKAEIDILLDELLRPKEFFAYTVHNGCTRNEYFEYKIDNHQFGKKEGCMFYEHGCQATYTHGSCNKILWNEVNSKTRVGLPCMGCTEPTFPKSNLFETKKNMGIPQYLPLGVHKRAYLTLAGITKAFSIKRLEEDIY
jgi:hydrogenase small subunit